MIKINNVSKMYRLGTVGVATIQDDLKRLWYAMRGKENPFHKVGQENVRDKEGGEYVWALKDVSFSVNKGEVVGLIGKNGAGKSTLLKLLSKVTLPSEGEIVARGRIASLLEVGTGFHPELTGRENIFLNGAILGMKKKEIREKFDRIVSFSGCEKYIDTPVKRYSSGMYVRLAFAVAAHLDPEILIVDEVLAVGDAEFQKKAIGKMKDVSKESARTVLFVSHNMEAIKNLCDRVIYMEKGKVVADGKPDDIITKYLEKNTEARKYIEYDDTNAPGNSIAKLKAISVEAIDGRNFITVNTPLKIVIKFFLSEPMKTNLSLNLQTSIGEWAFETSTASVFLEPGEHMAECIIPKELLNDKMYVVSFYLVKDQSKAVHYFEDCIAFNVDEEREKSNWHGQIPGVLRPKLEFQILDQN
jgi:lipopolysaccharide transport system ATP-binding protein